MFRRCVQWFPGRDSRLGMRLRLKPSERVTLPKSKALTTGVTEVTEEYSTSPCFVTSVVEIFSTGFSCRRPTAKVPRLSRLSGYAHRLPDLLPRFRSSAFVRDRR